MDKIGQRVEEAFPQDVRGDESVYVRFNDKSRKVVEIVSMDDSFDREDIATGKAGGGTTWAVPYCWECGNPKLTEPSILCDECNRVVYALLQDEIGR